MIAANPASPGADEAASLAAHAHAVENLDDNEYAKYLLQTRNEILPVLRGLVDHVAQITMFFNDGRDMVLTSPLRAEPDALLLDIGPSEETNHKALAAPRLFCVTQLDKVKVQFMLDGLTTVVEAGRPAFRAALPTSLMRLQRREFYRLPLPLTRPLAGAIEFTDASGQRQRLEVHASDISGGGIGLVGLPEDAPLEAGLALRLLRLELPEVGLVSGDLRVCSLATLTNRLGHKSLRAGCEFVKLPGTMQTLIQRYIIKVERERKARESGLG